MTYPVGIVIVTYFKGFTTQLASPTGPAPTIEAPMIEMPATLSGNIESWILSTIAVMCE